MSSQKNEPQRFRVAKASTDFINSVTNEKTAPVVRGRSFFSSSTAAAPLSAIREVDETESYTPESQTTLNP